MNNVKYLKSAGLHLISGNLEITNTPRDGIAITKRVSNKSNVLVNSTQFSHLKKALSTSPLTDLPIYIYDQVGNLVNKLEQDRKNNLGGTLGVNTEAQTLLSHMVIPPNTDGSTNYLLLQAYPHLSEISSDVGKLELLKNDFTALNAKADLKSVVLVIATPVYEEFVKIYPEFEAFFGNVFSVKQENIFSFVAEYLCGKVISGSKPSFQGFLNFGADATILRCVGDNAGIIYTIRSGGRVQVNTPAAKDSVSGKFLLYVVSTTMSYPFTITEEVTNSSVTIAPDMTIKPDTFPEIKFDYILQMMDNYHFGINLNPNLSYEKIMAFITDPANQVKVMKYLFASYPKIDKDYDKLSDEGKLLFNCYHEGYSTIKNSLIDMTTERNTSDGSALARAYANQGGGLAQTYTSHGGGPLMPPRYYEASSATPGFAQLHRG
jgi:hypothetical protein